jgi:hypothetical protein
MSTVAEIMELLDEQGKAQKNWREKQDARVDEMAEELKSIALKAGRPNLGGNIEEIKHLTMVDGKKLPLLTREQKAARIYQTDDSGGFNIGDFCRDAVVGSRKAASGAALVPTFVGAQMIDMVRSRTVLIEAGAQTIMIDGPTNLAKLTSGPTVHQHTEAATDITESDIVAAPVSLNPKLLAVLVPLTVELVQDSPNLDALLTMALAGAFASKLDVLGIAKLLADTNIPDSVGSEDPMLWGAGGVMAAVSSALVLNQRLPSAHISAPADFINRAMQVASTSGSWLGKPSVLANMLELQTTGLTAGTALFGNFDEALAVALRSDLRVEVVRHAKPTSASHLLVAHMRADFVVLQAAKLYKQLKTP